MEHKYSEELEKKINKDVIEREWGLSPSDNREYQAHLDMFDSIRSEKNYKWQSNISMPEFATHMLVQSANDVDQYFSSLDFVETYVMNDSDEAQAAAKATKKLINTTLNRRSLHHYHKFVRAKLINTINGYTFARAWWKQEQKTDIITEVNEYGIEIKIPQTIIIKDEFDYCVLDPRNVKCSPEYVYSVQEKKWVIIWSSTDYETLLTEKDAYGYFNLDIVKEKASTATGGQKDTKDGNKTISSTTLPTSFDKYERFGKFWVKDVRGKVVPGLKEDGEVMDKARLAECIITVVDIDGTHIMIGFYETPYVDMNGNPYRPIIRGLCYIHPEIDSGVGDGKYARELQIGMNDTINVANDRAMLATLPVLKVKDSTLTDNDSIFIKPGHAMRWNTDPNEIMEFKFTDDVQGALSMYSMYRGSMQQITSKYPQDMGNVPSLASTTATATNAASIGSSKRDKYKDLTFENTYSCDLYWMIQQMTYAFAKPETGMKLMGEAIYNFNPDYDFWFKPVSQAVESEQSKGAKIQRWNQLLQTLMGVQHPDLAKMINFIVTEIALLSGKEYANFANKLLNEKVPAMPSGANPEDMATGEGASNEQGIPQGQDEIMARENA